MIQIRKAYPTDAYTLIQISDLVWKNEFYDVLPNSIISERLKNIDARVHHLRDQIQENNRIFVAIDEENEKTIGFVFYAKSFNISYTSVAEIREIYVLPEYQRKGVGTLLFQSVINEVKKLGYLSLVVSCPLESSCIPFFETLGGIGQEVISKEVSGCRLNCELMYFDLKQGSKSEEVASDWNRIYMEAQNRLVLLNNIHLEIAVILTNQNQMYFGIGIKNKVCPLEGALSNMYLAQENKISKILILNRKSQPVLPCGKCRDLLVELGQADAEILFDIGTLKTMTMKELNPYYKDEEKV